MSKTIELTEEQEKRLKKTGVLNIVLNMDEDNPKVFEKFVTVGVEKGSDELEEIHHASPIDLLFSVAILSEVSSKVLDSLPEEDREEIVQEFEKKLKEYQKEME